MSHFETRIGRVRYLPGDLSRKGYIKDLVQTQKLGLGDIKGVPRQQQRLSEVRLVDVNSAAEL
jgi:hypothetical protein